MTERHSFCRLCLNGCAIKVEVEDNRAVRISGDKDNPVYRGFTCVKGREQGHLLADERRLRHSLKRQPDGSFVPIPVADAVDEIAERLQRTVEDSGPEAVAGYLGTFFAASAATMPLFGGFMAAIGSPMAFSPGTIDKPGKKIAQALHGEWAAPAVGFDDPEVIMLVGSNPLVSFTGFPYGNPGKWLNERLKAGATLIVIDPRECDVARRAHIHIQPRPGQDVAIVSAMLNTVFAERLVDADFLARHVQGSDGLLASIAAFTPQEAARRAGVSAADIVAAARALGSTRRGYINAGTGPNMSGRGTLVEYLLLCLHTACGYWLREGDTVRHPGALAAPLDPRAEVLPHKAAYGFGPDLGVRGLRNTAAGMPTAALSDKILTEGPDRIRAMISCGGNPVAAWPDQRKTIAAMERLELLVQIDPWMSATARLADYVIAPRIWLEVPGTSQVLDWLTRNGTGYGQVDPYAQYSPAILDDPEDSDLIEEWEFFYELARTMGYDLSIHPAMGDDLPPVALSMQHKPTTDEVLEALARGSRIPLSQVKAREGGAIYETEAVHVAAGSGQERFDFAAPDMLDDLSKEALDTNPVDGRFRLLCRRMMHVYNSSFVGALPSNARPYNPAFMAPSDMERLGIEEGADVRMISEHDAIPAIAMADPTLRPGTVSMSFGFGGLPSDDAAFRLIGSNPARLLRNDEIYDRYSGQPLMTNIAVDIVPSREAAETAAAEA